MATLNPKLLTRAELHAAIDHYRYRLQNAQRELGKLTAKRALLRPQISTAKSNGATNRFRLHTMGALQDNIIVVIDHICEYKSKLPQFEAEVALRGLTV